MIRRQFKAALRHLRRAKGYTAINVIGLAVGSAACVFMLLFVRHELSFDRFHPDADRIVRLGTEMERDGRIQRRADIHTPLLPGLDELPAIDEKTIVGGARRSVLETEAGPVYLDGIASADEHVFDVFDFRLIRGDQRTALVEPYSIVITPSLADRLFGEADPMGRTITLSDDAYTVTGVLEPIPANSHMQFEGLTSFATGRAEFGASYDRMMGSWFGYLGVYVKLREGAVRTEFETALNHMSDRLRPDDGSTRYRLFAQPLTDIHLGPSMSGQIGTPGSRSRLFVLSTIAALILLIACINYANLATARSLRRAREIGIRKTFGARRSQLIAQLLGESILLGLAAVILAVGLLELSFPSLETLLGREFEFSVLGDPVVVTGLLVLALSVGVTAGVWPALVLSRARPASVFSGRVESASLGSVRKTLVVLQFAVSIALIAGTGVIRDQLDFIRTADVGFSRDRIVSIVRSDARAFVENYHTIRQELLSIPGVEMVTASMGRPGIDVPETSFDPDAGGSAESLEYKYLAIDYDFLRTFDIALIAGRDLDVERVTDETDAFIVNEAAVAALGLDDPIGHRLQLELNNRAGTIVGVVKDFHVGSLHEPIKPTILYMAPLYFHSSVHVRIGAESIPEVMDRIETIWTGFFPAHPFEYSFYDDAFNAQYDDEQRMSRVAGLASGLAIFVACLGLFGLASLAARRRTREIGIRKVLGASVASIVRLLTTDFLRLFVAALVVAAPVTWIAMDRWLAEFAYRTDPGPAVFAAAAAVAGLLTLLTVGSLAVRAALANPVDSLRTE